METKYKTLIQSYINAVDAEFRCATKRVCTLTTGHDNIGYCCIYLVLCSPLFSINPLVLHRRTCYTIHVDVVNEDLKSFPVQLLHFV